MNCYVTEQDVIPLLHSNSASFFAAPPYTPGSTLKVDNEEVEQYGNSVSKCVEVRELHYSSVNDALNTSHQNYGMESSCIPLLFVCHFFFSLSLFLSHASTEKQP